jgi:hypothetical protein
VIPNGNKQAGGWLPVYDEDGKQSGNTYWSRGYDLDTALKMAKEDAERLAEKFVGDWNVIVEQKPGSPGAPKHKAVKTAKPKAASPRPSPWGEAGTASDTLPWRNSYANWTTRVGEAAARHNARIAFGSDTYEAWEKGVSPDAYAKARARK